MYNMDISVFGYKINLEILILIALIYLIMVGHTFCGCYNYGLMEGFTDASGNTIDVSGNLQERKENVQAKVANAKTNLAAQSAAGTATDATPVTSATTTTTEGFTGANINYGESSLYSLSQDDPVDTSSWSAQNMTVVPGQPLSAGVKAFLERKPTQVPLPEGEMFMFANTEFKPECCPNTYSNSSGCACMDSNSYNYLITRGMNNVPYSEY
jgi:hypothetical protein